ncbi:hypothetical protein GCM10007096_26170 [Pullulanibacillus pueri]|uniref:Uncharacterized protein n=1 Tax=Pullulanibacillus pueri TaxID=1437324 RepID=A0A8J2ZX85_9BACL|nr:hypothetical protein GCM10007096_26170 [Pullulanibacillus pueri]
MVLRNFSVLLRNGHAFARFFLNCRASGRGKALFAGKVEHFYKEVILIQSPWLWINLVDDVDKPFLSHFY